MPIAIALIVVLLGSVLFHFLSPWNLTPLASNWGSVDSTIGISFWVTGIVFAAVNLFMVYAILRYRYRKGRRAHYEPENKKLEAWLTGLTTVGIAALLAPGLVVWDDFVRAPDDAQRLEVVGHQWGWSFRFPGEDGTFGAVDTELIGEDNPFGMVPDDPAGRDDVLVDRPRVLLPVDRPVKAVLRSKDVIHNFQVAQFRAKMDLVPGQTSYLWLEPKRTGQFEILCAELCGIGHFAMRGLLEVVEQSRFDTWLAQQPTHGEIREREPPDPQAGKKLYATCSSGHGPKGQGKKQLNAPKLAGLEPWYVMRQLRYFKEGLRGAHPDDKYGQQMRSFAQTLPDRAARADVAAYIETFPDQEPEETVVGDIESGHEVFDTCASCHGADGQGDYRHNAPRLSGMSDWYLLRQIRNFRKGVRGAHPQDVYGGQMAKMAEILIGDRSDRNVVAYINTLPRGSQKLAQAERAEEE